MLDHELLFLYTFQMYWKLMLTRFTVCTLHSVVPFSPCKVISKWMTTTKLWKEGRLYNNNNVRLHWARAMIMWQYLSNAPASISRASVCWNRQSYINDALMKIRKRMRCIYFLIHELWCHFISNVWKQWMFLIALAQCIARARSRVHKPQDACHHETVEGQMFIAHLNKLQKPVTLWQTLALFDFSAVHSSACKFLSFLSTGSHVTSVFQSAPNIRPSCFVSAPRLKRAESRQSQ